MSDPIDLYRERLGDRGVAPIATRAAALRDFVASHDDRWLGARAAELASSVPGREQDGKFPKNEYEARRVAVLRELEARRERKREAGAQAREGSQGERGQAQAEEARVVDPLDRFRGVLGEHRAHAIDARARELREFVAEQSPEWLQQQREALGAPFSRLNGAGARAMLRIERDRPILLHERNMAEHMESANNAVDRLDALDVEERVIHEQGRHPEAWMEKHKEVASRWVAVGRVVAEREQAQQQRLEAEQRELANTSIPAQRERVDLAPEFVAPEVAEDGVGIDF